ncbi:hypothetical protein GCM10022284_58610 [Streptomyces hundungensis]
MAGGMQCVAKSTGVAASALAGAASAPVPAASATAPNTAARRRLRRSDMGLPPFLKWHSAARLRRQGAIDGSGRKEVNGIPPH